MEIMHSTATAGRSCLAGHLLLLAQRALYVPLGISLGCGIALVVLLLAFAQTNQQLGVAVADINLQRHQRVAFLLSETEQFVNFGFLEKKLARSRRIARIEPVTLFERANMHIMNERFAVTNQRERIADVGPAVAQRLDLRAG